MSIGPITAVTGHIPDPIEALTQEAISKLNIPKLLEQPLPPRPSPKRCYTPRPSPVHLFLRGSPVTPQPSPNLLVKWPGTPPPSPARAAKAWPETPHPVKGQTHRPKLIKL